MNSKLIITAAGAFGMGALWGWALTGDHQATKARSNRDALRDVIRNQAVRIGRLQSNMDPLLVQKTINGGSEDHETDEPLPFESVEPGTSARLIEQAKLRSITITPAGDGMGSIELVTPVDEVGADIGQTDEHGVREDTHDEAHFTEDDEQAFPDGETEEETRTNLQSLIERYSANQDDVDTFVNISEPHTKADFTPPFVISQARYAWDDSNDGMSNSYSKISVTFYPKQNTLLDEDDELIADIGSTVGWESLRQFGFESTDADVVFVRNHRLETDFEVIRDTENPLPPHITFNMGKEEYRTNKAAGLINFERGARD